MKGKQSVERYFRDEKSGSMNPKITLEKCVCGKLPAYFGSTGGFNYYGYYKCLKCNLFATGKHQFPVQIMDLISENKTEPKLFVVYNDESNPENGWNDFIKEKQKA